MKEDGGAEVDISMSRPSVMKEAKDTQGIHSGGSSSDNMASDLRTPQSHAIKDGNSVISKGWCVRRAFSPEFTN